MEGINFLGILKFLMLTTNQPTNPPSPPVQTSKSCPKGVTWESLTNKDLIWKAQVKGSENGAFRLGALEEQQSRTDKGSFLEFDLKNWWCLVLKLVIFYNLS